MRKMCMVLFVALLSPLFLAGAAEPLFQADFNDQAKAAAQWDNLAKLFKAQDAALRDGKLELNALSPTEKALSLAPSVALPTSYSVEFDAMVTGRCGADNHFLLSVNGANVVFRQWSVVCLDGKKETVGEKGAMLNNKERRFLVEASDRKVKVFCDSTLVCAVDTAKTSVGTLRLSAYNSKVLFGDFKIHAGERSKKAVTANLLRNSSFEVVNNDLPDYWGSAHWGMLYLPWRNQMDEFRRRWRLDRGEAFDGNNSFRIETPGNKPDINYGLGLYSCWPLLRKGAVYTFSVYLKSDRDALPVQIGSRLAKSEPDRVEVGKEWSRHSVSFTCGQPMVEQMRIQPLAAGTLWVDAAQLEEGAQVTPYVRHGSELPAASDGKPAVSVTVPHVEQAPVLDGNLDDPAWKRAARGRLVNIKDGGAPAERTELLLVRDENNLYMAAECFDSQMDKLVANVKSDKGPIWNDDSVEFYFKPDEKGNSFYQFALNTLGKKYEGKAFADLAWSADWRAKVVKGPKSWVAEIAVPFSTLAIPSGKDSLVFQFARGNKKNGENSAWAPTYCDSFQEFKHWGRLNLGSEVGGVSVGAMRLGKAAPVAGTQSFSTTLVNQTAKDINAKLELLAKAKSMKQELLLKAHSSVPVEFSGLELPDGQDCEITLSCWSDGNLLLTKRERLKTCAVLSVTREFSYFSDEKEMRFAVDINGRDLPDGMTLQYGLFRGQERLLEQTQSVPGRHAVVAIPNRFGPGDLRLAVELFGADRKPLGKAEERFAALAHNANEGKINLWRHSIYFAGKEFFIWGNGWEGWPDEAAVKLNAENGFNTMILMVQSVPSEAKVREVLDMGERHNVKFLLYVSHAKGGLAAMVPALLGHPAFLGFFPLDEMGSKNASSAEIDSVYRDLRQAAGWNSLVFHNENDYGVMQRTNMSGADIVSLDHYTIPERELASVTLILEGLKQLAGNRPTHFFAQSTGNAYMYGREPTPEELSNQVYQSIACDVWNISFFANLPLGAESFPTLKRLGGELGQLIALGVPAAPAAELRCGESDIKFLCRETPDSYVIVAVNTRNAAVNAKFAGTWIPAGERAEVKFEGREVKTGEGALEDEFQPLDRHVYVIDKGGSWFDRLLPW